MYCHVAFKLATDFASSISQVVDRLSLVSKELKPFAMTLNKLCAAASSEPAASIKSSKPPQAALTQS